MLWFSRPLLRSLTKTSSPVMQRRMLTRSHHRCKYTRDLPLLVLVLDGSILRSCLWLQASAAGTRWAVGAGRGS